MIIKEQLEELYIRQNKIRRKIAEELNVPISQVNFYLNKYHIKKIIKKLEKVCPICGKHFFISSTLKQKKYCCRACSRLGTRRAERKICPNCGKEFPVRYKNSICCSKRCSKEYKIKLNREIHINICQECGKEYEYFNDMLNWFKEGQHESNKYHGIDSSKYCCYECGIKHRQKVSRKTCLERYGKEFTGQTENNLNKTYKTKLKKYGNAHYVNPIQIAKSLKNKSKEEKLEIRNKICKTKLEKYNDPYYNGNKVLTEEEKLIKNKKTYNTKKKNNSFTGKGKIENQKCSLDEQKIYEILITKFISIEFNKFVDNYGKCDFYIPELDLYIEYQGTWRHGKYKNKIYGPYNPNNIEHKKLLCLWQDKSKSGHPSYLNAIYTWTINDVRKREAAKRNNFNWIEFFTINEFMDWFRKQ